MPQEKPLDAQLDFILAAYKSGKIPTNKEFSELKAAFEMNKKQSTNFLHGVQAILSHGQDRFVIVH